MEKVKGQYRHGDVLLTPVSSVPDGGQEMARDSITLAEGEVTGYRHQLTGNAVLIVHEGRRFLVVDGEPAMLTHEEHGLIVVQPGQYEVIQQREWDLTGQWRQVMD